MNQPGDWSNELKEPEGYFKGVTLPAEPIRLDNCTKVVDVRLFLNSHILTAKKNNGSRYFKAHLDRLRQLKQAVNLK